LINKKPLRKIIVAIIDDGVDSKHPDLAGMLWTNRKEIPGNGIDDDNDGYRDDVNGWNFAGNNKDETYEEIREYVRLRSKFENKDSLIIKADPQYAYWQRILAEKNKRVQSIQSTLKLQVKILSSLGALQNYWSKQLKTDSVNVGILKNHPLNAATDSSIVNARAYLMSFSNSVQVNPDSTLISSIMKRLRQRINETTKSLSDINTVIQKNDAAYFRKKALGDDPYINDTKTYGNADTYPDYTHGTECAGVIAALRNNGIGGNGITNSVEIMPLRIVASGNADEWDKDVSNAIRYAVNNGAQVISMSFGKYFSPQRDWVKAAVKFAEQKNVVLIRAAMNDAINTDLTLSYPQEYYSDNDRASNLITVGASSYDSTLVANFSNYGFKTVDVFAPGVSIYMPVLKGGYTRGNGTSFACPVVAGLAALLWSYYPNLNYRQVRQCIEESVKPENTAVMKPGTKEKVPFSTLSRMGGIVNAYDALNIAERISKANK
jgi:cell wall-associated protease